MKKLLILLLLVPSLSWGDELDDLNSFLRYFESKVDTCIEEYTNRSTLIKSNCVVELGDQYLDIQHNTKLNEIITSGKCQYGTKCRDNLTRIKDKVVNLIVNIW